ncbi:MAG: acetoin utilization protein [Phycisphaerae bacterium]
MNGCGTGLVWSSRYLEHATGPLHPERPDRLRAIHAALRTRNLLQQLTLIEPRQADLAAIERVHDPDYIRHFREACARGNPHIDTPECPLSPVTFDIARLAVGGVLDAVDAVMAGRVRNAFCPVRPPGHHAEEDQAMGFCYFNNVAIAAEHLRSCHGLNRVAILDWDVHHGNGTQHHFEREADVLVCNIHQHPNTLFPGTGFEWEQGIGPGLGATVNAPMMPGADDEDYRVAFEERLLPALRAFRPEFLLVCVGFDPHRDDPLAQIELSTEMFGWMTVQAMTVAEESCAGRLVSILEGGYDLQASAESALAHVEALTGTRAPTP